MAQSSALSDTLRLIVDRLAEAVVLHDASGTVVWSNPSAVRLFGRWAEPGALAPGSAQGLGVVQENGVGLAWRDHPVMRALITGQPLRDVVIGVARDGGAQHWLSASAEPVKLEASDRPSWVVASYADLTALREGQTRQQVLEAQLRQSQKMEAIGQLTGGIAHDFNNLLTAIITNAELLADEIAGASEDAKAELEDLRRAARLGAELVRKLTTFSRRDKPVLVRVDPASMLWDAARLLRRVVPENIELVTNIAKDLPPILAEAAALEQVLVNLATNARDAMPRGGQLRIEAGPATLGAAESALLGWGQPGPIVRLVVSDTGGGMDAATLERIYEPFFTTKPVGEGSGLGLSIVYGVMQQHGAHLRVESDPGKGTRVTMCFLPAPAGAAGAAGTADEIADAPTGSETILLVEDNEGVRAATRRILEHRGYRVLTAATGDDALQIYQIHQGQVALVLADVVMPRMGGIDLAAALRRQGASVRILLASGYTEREAEATALGIPIFKKPWTPADLARRVREALDGDHQPRSGGQSS